MKHEPCQFIIADRSTLSRFRAVIMYEKYTNGCKKKKETYVDTAQRAYMHIWPTSTPHTSGISYAICPMLIACVRVRL